MRAVVAWTDYVPEHDGVRSVCFDIAFRPDGSQLIAAVGSRVLMYDAADGDLLHSLKGHKDAVYCVAYSRDGKRFASGGADKTIIIWTHKAEGILKYSHGDSIQCLAYNPVTQQLASGTATDFGIWSPEQKSVSKHKAQSKVLCAAWTVDGQHLALGMYNGHISICDKSGIEQVMIERPGPVWTLEWNSLQNKTSDALAVGCWDGTLSFYDLTGKQVGKDKDLGFDPCCVTYQDDKYLCVGGSSRKVMLYSKDGVKLTTMCETGDWIWVIQSRPKHDFVVVGCNDGSISMLQLLFSTVHGLYLERYAFRDAMTNVVIQHLISDAKVTIRCRDYIRKIAVYQERVAVQVTNQIIVYELNKGGAGAKGQYRVCARINGCLECNLLVLTSEHITLCQETKLQLFSLLGTKEREWVLESTIRYIKVCGGPRGGECLLIGMKSGLIVKVWINNNFPNILYKHTSGIRCLDLSSQRVHLAIVDETANILVYDIETKEITFQEKGASSVAWNTNMEDMLCYSGNGMLNIKTADFPVHRKKLQGYVVGFQGSKIFCLNHLSMQTIEVPQSTSMSHYVKKCQFDNAYKVACLGVTEVDWRMLALAALKGHAWDVAKKGFIRLRDVCYLDLLHRFEQGHCSDIQKATLGALILAYQGKFKEAADAYIEAGQVGMAMEMYSDLRMFEEAKALAQTGPTVQDVMETKACREVDVQEIIQRQAEWTEQTNDHETAADMYLAANQPEKALALLVAHGPVSKLIEVARRLKKTQIQDLTLCAMLMRRGGQYAHAFETYTKLADFRSVISLHVELEQWEDAFAVKRLHPEIEDGVTLPYAQWLISQDRFDAARIAYSHAGRPDLSEHLLKQLLENALKEKRFKDAAQICNKLASEGLTRVTELAKMNKTEMEKLQYEEFGSLKQLANVLYAYSFIYQSINEPFRITMPETLFNISRFLLAQIARDPPTWHISIVNVLVTLAKHSEQLGFYKISTHAYNRLQNYKIPTSWGDKIEVATLIMRGKAHKPDEPQMDLPVCYACSSPFPMTSSITKDACGICSQPIFRSFITFDQLPLVEFVLDKGVSHEQAMEAISAIPTKDDNSHNIENPFHLGQELLLSSSPGLIQATLAMLTNLPPSRVMVQTCNLQYEKPRYFLLVDPSFPLTQCLSCHHFFEQEEWDLATLEEGCCPFCGVKDEPLDAEERVLSLLTFPISLKPLTPMSKEVERPKEREVEILKPAREDPPSLFSMSKAVA